MTTKFCNENGVTEALEGLYYSKRESAKAKKIVKDYTDA